MARWQSTISERYISDPIPGTFKNDLIFSTGFNIAWSHYEALLLHAGSEPAGLLLATAVCCRIEDLQESFRL